MIESYRGAWPEIHPTAFVHQSAVVIGEVRIGPRASVWPGAVLRGDMGPIEVGEDSNIQDNCVLHNTGGISATRVGARVTVGHRALLHGCIVGDDVLVGMGSVLLDNCRIPSHTLVGAAALVSMKKEFDSGFLLLGSPATPARPLRQEDRDWIAYSWRVYVETAANYPKEGT